MNNVTMFIVAAVSLCLAAILITASVNVSSSGLDLTKKAITELGEAITLDDVDYDRVNSDNLSGLEVVQLLQHFDSAGFGHLVVTSGNKEGFYSIDGVNDIHSDNYINPAKTFTGCTISNVRENTYAVKFVENGQQNVKFNRKLAASVGKGTDTLVQEAQYSLFKKFLLNRAKCNRYLQLCSKWGDTIIRLEDARMRALYAKYANDGESQQQYMNSEIASYDLRKQFYNAVTEAVKEWTKSHWFEAILTINDYSSEDLSDYDTSQDNSDSDWWKEDENSDFDDKVKDDNATIDSKDSEVNDGITATIIPDPTPEPTLEPTEEPIETETPITTEEPVTSEEPVMTENPITQEPERVPIQGPDS